MTDKKYILDKNHELIETDLITWARFLEDIKNRRVAQDFIGDSRKTTAGEIAKLIIISTVFLGIDHNFGEGEPLLFETMIFGGKRDEEQERWHTWKEAEEGHQKIVKEFKNNKI